MDAGIFAPRIAARVLPALGSRRGGRDHRLSRASAARRPMKRARALLFDLDGTLTDNYAGIAALDPPRARMPRARRRPTTRALRRCVGPPLRESFARLLDTRRPRADRARARVTTASATPRSAGARTSSTTASPMRSQGSPPAMRAFCSVHGEAGSRSRGGSSTHFGSMRTSPACTAPISPGASTTRRRCSRISLATERLDPRDAVMIGDRDERRAGGAREPRACDRRAVGLRDARRARGRRRAGRDAGGAGRRAGRRQSSA